MNISKTLGISSGYVNHCIPDYTAERQILEIARSIVLNSSIGAGLAEKAPIQISINIDSRKDGVYTGGGSINIINGGLLNTGVSSGSSTNLPEKGETTASTPPAETPLELSSQAAGSEKFERLVHILGGLGKDVLDKFFSNLSAKKLAGVGKNLWATAKSALNQLVNDNLLSNEQMLKIRAEANGQKKVSETQRRQADGAVRTSTHTGEKIISSKLPKGFLWKPVAESPPHGLVVLLPPALSKDVKSLQIVDPESGKVLASGRYAGIGNGDRAHFRFSEKGSSFPPGAIVTAISANGERLNFQVANTSSRTEGK